MQAENQVVGSAFRTLRYVLRHLFRFWHRLHRQGIFNNNRAKCLTLVFALDLGTFSLAEYFKPWIRFCYTTEIT